MKMGIPGHGDVLPICHNGIQEVAWCLTRLEEASKLHPLNRYGDQPSKPSISKTLTNLVTKHYTHVCLYYQSLWIALKDTKLKHCIY